MKEIKGKDQLQEKIKAGVDQLTDVVASTLGPCGRNVLLKDKERKPYITKDGVSCAKHISLQDPFENAAATILRQAAEQTATGAGDGTSTSSVLARAMLHGSFAVLKKGSSPIELQRGMNKAGEVLSQKLKERSKKLQSLEEIEQVATISANGDRGLGKLIASAVDAVGKNGSIIIQEGKSSQTSLDLQEGFRFEGGFEVNQFITNEKTASVRYENALVLVTDLDLSTAEQVQPVAELAAREERPLIVVGEKMEGQALGTLIYHHLRGNLKCAFVKVASYGEERRNTLDDLAVAIGAKFLSRLNGDVIQKVQLSDLAVVETFEATKYETIIVAKENTQSAVDERLERLKSQLSQTNMGQEAIKLSDRITRLSSAVAVINVGAPTEVEMKEKKDRIEDALEAVKSAQEEGVLPGGGATLIRLSSCLDLEKWENSDQKAGAMIVKFACYEPLRQMLRNAGLETEEWINKLLSSKEQNEGVDVYNKEFCDLVERGIIDPCKVTRLALLNAISAAGTLITTSFASIEVS